MTIERLHFPEGQPFAPFGSIEEEGARLFKDNPDKIKILPEGIFDLTPKTWIGSFTEYGLMVLGNGSGIYKEISKRPNNKYIVHLPQDKSIEVVFAPLKEEKIIGIFDVIRYVPGVSPKNESETKDKRLIPAGII